MSNKLLWAHRCGTLCHAQAPLLDLALQGLGIGITNGQAEKGMQAEHDKKTPANVGYIGRLKVGQVKAMLEHFIESIRKREEDFNNNEAKEEV